MKCPECNGTGEAVYSCCTGQVITGDIQICPKCKEHLGEEICQLCGGLGEVEDGEYNIDMYDYQLQLEHLNQIRNDSKSSIHTGTDR